MPKNPRKSGTRKNRRTTQPNVFVQSESTPSDDVIDEGTSSDTATSGSSAPRVRARVERTTRRASVRSEIYTRSLPRELKKMGALSGLIVIALVVLTIAL